MASRRSTETQGVLGHGSEFPGGGGPLDFLGCFHWISLECLPWISWWCSPWFSRGYCPGISRGCSRGCPGGVSLDFPAGRVFPQEFPAVFPSGFPRGAPSMGNAPLCATLPPPIIRVGVFLVCVNLCEVVLSIDTIPWPWERGSHLGEPRGGRLGDPRVKLQGIPRGIPGGTLVME